MSRRTATTAHALLGLLALRTEWSTWELTKQLRRNMRFFWPRAESQIYQEAKSLVARGWALNRRGYTGDRPKTTYAITEDGRKALEAWLSTPPKPPRWSANPCFASSCPTTLGLTSSARRWSRSAPTATPSSTSDASSARSIFRARPPFQDQLHVRAFVLDFLSHHARSPAGMLSRTTSRPFR